MLRFTTFTAFTATDVDNDNDDYDADRRLIVYYLSSIILVAAVLWCGVVDMVWGGCSAVVTTCCYTIS